MTITKTKKKKQKTNKNYYYYYHYYHLYSSFHIEMSVLVVKREIFGCLTGRPQTDFEKMSGMR